MPTLKKHLLAVGFTTFALIGGAKTVSPEVALSRLNESSNHALSAPNRATTNMELRSTVMTHDNCAPAIYIFSRSNELMLLAADDVAEPLLGYFDMPAGQSSADLEKMPPQLQWWLSEYAAQIAAASTMEVAPKSQQASSPDAPPMVEARHAERAYIAPLCSTKWNQDAPYNIMCPTVNGTPCYTGCTATAMAQVMKYWNYPDTGEGIISYNVNDTNESKGVGERPTGTLTLDCSSVDFDWEICSTIIAANILLTRPMLWPNL